MCTLLKPDTRLPLEPDWSALGVGGGDLDLADAYAATIEALTEPGNELR